MEKLAIHGGPKAKTVPYGSEKRYGLKEVEYLTEALEQDTLFYWKGNMAKRVCAKMEEMYKIKHCAVTSSGTSAIHTALGACGVGPGDEVITSPITDMGSIIGILFQNAVPVFADLDLNNYCMTAESIEEKITDKTKAVVLVHLGGNAAEVDKIADLCKAKGVYLIEDCAQSWCCEYKGKYIGTYGDIGCLSVNDFKHISAGDGGMVITDNDELYHKAVMFADKNYNRFGADVARNSDRIGINYRMSELVAAVTLAQLEKVEDICRRRNAYGDALIEGIKDLPGITPPKIYEGVKSSYGKPFLFRIDAKELGATREQFAQALNAEGITCSVGYIKECIYQMELFRKQSAFGEMGCPFTCPYYGKKVEYTDGLCPNAEDILVNTVALYVHEAYTKQDLEESIAGIRKVANYFYANKK